MSINGIPGSGLTTSLPQRTDPTRPNANSYGLVVNNGTRPPITVQDPAPQAATAAPHGAIPSQPPPGTDPVLWSVLSADERAFFARLGAMGPLTYGRVLNSQPASSMPALRGGRLDVKV